MATTSNFGWETPDDTDYVKDGAAAIRTLGSAIDASMVDLKGGTTGQILSKASNTDMDFAWAAAPSTDTLIPKSIIDAAGDLIIGSAADTPARLAIGTNGQVLTSNGTSAEWATPSSGAYTLLLSGNLSGTSVSISPIPSGYRKIVLVVKKYNYTSASIGDLLVTPNSNSTGNVDTNDTGNGDTNNQTYFYGMKTYGASNNLDSIMILEFPEYATTGVQRLMQGLIRNNYGSNSAYVSRGVWRSTSAITSLTLTLPYTATAGTWELYGVK